MLDDRTAPFGYIIFCLVIGAFLIVIPWHELWDSNFLLVYVPPLRSIVLDNHFRGAVSGLGVVDVILGIAALVRLIRRRLFRVPEGDAADGAMTSQPGSRSYTRPE